MEYEFQIHNDYVEVIINGEFDLSASKATVDKVQQYCREHRLTKVLVNSSRLAGKVSVGSRFGLGEYLATRSAPGARVAILTSSQTIRESKTLQLTANNRGAQVITTDSMEEALAFLAAPAG